MNLERLFDVQIRGTGFSHLGTSKHCTDSVPILSRNLYKCSSVFNCNKNLFDRIVIQFDAGLYGNNVYLTLT